VSNSLVLLLVTQCDDSPNSSRNPTFFNMRYPLVVHGFSMERKMVMGWLLWFCGKMWRWSEEVLDVDVDEDFWMLGEYMWRDWLFDSWVAVVNWLGGDLIMQYGREEADVVDKGI